ncbi:hypothetical protein EFZ10_13090 [Tatumella sp. TA1]|nr:hypothetical protein EFZ10_13090 [Tatumella sp. TA1]
MLRYDLTPNNGGIVLWGDAEALSELHTLIHNIVDESPIIKVKDGFMLALAYDIRKAREGFRRDEPYQYEQLDAYRLYGIELLWPMVLIQAAILRNAMSYMETDKNQLSVMYAFEYLLESALKELMPINSDAVLQVARFAADSDLMFVEDCIDSRCCYFIDLSPAQRKKQLASILRSCDSLWGQFSREPQDINMLNKMNTTDWAWPDKIKW